jgi:uncharacterized phage infection (PIP) family protein YhgE
MSTISETNGADGSATASAAEKPALSALETANAQFDEIKASLRAAVAGLNKLGDTLRQAGREQRANDKEIQSVRQSIRSLQSVRL